MSCLYPNTEVELIMPNLLLIETEMNYNFLFNMICHAKSFIWSSDNLVL